jgi:protein-S-isoprenylcysteine O-methyltransferase Ste14
MFGNLDHSAAAYLIGYVIFVAIRGRYDKGGTSGSVRHGSQIAERAVMAATGIGVMLMPLLYVATPWLDGANYAPLHWQFLIGVATMIASLWLFWRAHHDLGRNFSRTLEIHSGHRLVTEGVYARIRHPIYAAIWLFALAQALLLPNWIAGLSGLVGFLPMYALRTPVEEQMMLKAFGDSYSDYVKRTGRVCPHLWQSTRRGGAS